ncbi:hypothetical protein Fmac_019860 [Flemingia macrophylla]|uniref:Uncharacterized protein n=1 Tax=Flemingia macrophylla TaxID=520843 RepID=A0ABD1M927_9FABA
MADSPMNSIFIPFKRPVEQSLIETAGITNFGVYFEATSGFSQTRDSVHYRHSTLSSEVERSGESVDATVNSKGDIPYEEFKERSYCQKSPSLLQQVNSG